MEEHESLRLFHPAQSKATRQRQWRLSRKQVGEHLSRVSSFVLKNSISVWIVGSHSTIRGEMPGFELFTDSTNCFRPALNGVGSYPSLVRAFAISRQEKPLRIAT